MIVEFVGGPLDGELREIPDEWPLRIGFPPPRPLTADEKAAINLREGVYEWRKWSKDGKRYMVWQGEL